MPVAPTDIHVTVPHHDAIPHHQAGVGPVPAGVPSLNDVLSGGYDPESIGDIRQGDASSKSEYSVYNYHNKLIMHCFFFSQSSWLSVKKLPVYV